MLISPVLTLVAVGEAISNPRQGVGGLTIFSFVTLTAGTGLLVYSFRKKQYLLDEAVTLFNSRLDQSVHLGTTAHGVGLVYTF